MLTNDELQQLEVAAAKGEAIAAFKVSALVLEVRISRAREKNWKDLNVLYRRYISARLDSAKKRIYGEICQYYRKLDIRPSITKEKE